ncbi:MAG: TraR/DksA family transcriptional regulator [Geodermatophilaceae bacterium]|jgi:RNA polymerase-binding transcription factor DksA
MSLPSDLTSAQQKTLRARVLEAADRARTDLAALRADFAAIVAASAQSNADDEHDPEGATIAFERAQVRSLIERALASESAAAQALARWESGTYGRCEICAAAIGYERLLARPATTRCIEHAAA